MNLTDQTTIVELIDGVRGLDASGRDTIWFQRVIIGGRETTIAVGTGDAGRLIERLMTKLLQQRGQVPDPRSGPGVPSLPWEEGT